MFNLLKKWCKIKEKISEKENDFFFHEKEIRWMNMWKNIGYEQDWKWENFLRPVLIIRKFSKNLFLWIPLTTQVKDWNYFYNFKFKNKKNNKILKNSAILVQSKSFSKKRLKDYIWMISDSDFKNIKNELRKLI